MRILFAGGGTAGHINPALSIANYIKEKEPQFEALFIGTKRGLETKLVPSAGYDIKYIDICGINRKNLLKNISVIRKLQKAKKDMKKIIEDFKPDAVVCTGGYVSGPVMMAAHKAGVPAIIHEQNVYPGLTVKGSQKYADYIAVSFTETMEFIKKCKCVVTGNPIRPEVLRANSEESRAKLGMTDKPFVLVFGGSLGAGKINDTMIEVLKYICKDESINLLFGTGDKNFNKVMEKIKEENVILPEGVKVVPYINNMNEVMSACDIVVSRAGAITVSEIAALGKASILIPSPNVVRNHQEQNAREFEKNGAAKVITEDELTPKKLYDTMIEMASDDEERHKMQENVKKLAKTNATEEIYNLVKTMIK